MAQLNLDYLRSFRLVVEHGSFSAAADRIGLTQPAVSLQVRQLERQLGTVLVERIGRRAQPTAAGLELLAHAGAIDAAVSGAVEAVSRHAGAAGRVRLGTGATACIFVLPPLLRALRKAHPDVEITVTTGNASEIVSAVETNTLDVGLVALPVSSRALEITPVIEDTFLVIAPTQMKLPPDGLTAEALARLPLLLFEPGGNTRRLVDDWFAAQGVHPRPIMSLGSVEAIKELVGAGLGCAILPGMAVTRDGGRGRGLQVRPLAPELHRTLAVIVRRDKRLTRGLRDMVKALKALPGAA